MPVPVNELWRLKTFISTAVSESSGEYTNKDHVTIESLKEKFLKRYCLGRFYTDEYFNMGLLALAYIDIYHNNHFVNILWYKVAVLVY